MDLRTYCVGSGLFGGAVWLIRVALLRPHPAQTAWAVTLLLFAPLILVPLGLRLVTTADRHPPAWRVAVLLQLPAALLLTVAFILPPGTAAAAMTLPWLACTGLIALIGLSRL